MEIINREDQVIVRLNGEIDHHTAAEMRFRIDGELNRSVPSLLILDFSGVDFMDSSGIGLILGRMRLVAGWGGRVAVVHPNAAVRKMIGLSGLDKLLKK